jgi:uncharacterized membrane protein
MGQDNTSNSQYGSGYGGYSGYTPQPDPNDPYGNQNQNQQYGQPGGYGQQQQQAPFDAYSYGQGGQGQQQQQQYGQQQSNFQQPYGQQQQFRAYVPPVSVLQGGTAYDTTSTGLSARTAALLSYALGWFSGLILFVIERKNSFVRFAAAQSVVFFGTMTIIYFLVRIIGGILGAIPLLGLIINPIFGLVAAIIWIFTFLVWVFLLIQSYRGKTVRLPIFSTYADSMVNRSSRRQKP